MSSSGKEPGPVWQGPVDASRSQGQGQIFEYAGPVGQGELNALPALPAQVAAGKSPINTPHPVSRGEVDEQEEPPATFSEKVKQYAGIILTPLLFGGLTSFFVLPLVAEGTGRASVPPDSIWLIAAMIFVVAIAQGVATYYAGTNNSLWAVATLGGFSLFLLIGCLAIFGPVATLVLLIALLALCVVLGRFYYHAVPEGFVDIITVSGKYRRTLSPGFNLLFPWEKMSERFNVQEIQWLCPMQCVQLSYGEDVHLRATIAYQLRAEYADLAFKEVKQWEESLRQYFIDAIQNIAAPKFVPDDFIAWPDGLHTTLAASENAGNASSVARREHINDSLCQHMDKKVATWGVVIRGVSIRDVVLAPHEPVVIAQQPNVQATTSTEQAAADQPTRPSPAQQPQMQMTVQNHAGATAAGPKAAPLFDQPGQATPTKIPSEEVLKKAYTEVQDGKVTDPVAIRNIAALFRAVANDTQARLVVTFDPERAALNLYEQADKYEEQYRTGSLYGGSTKRD